MTRNIRIDLTKWIWPGLMYAAILVLCASCANERVTSISTIEPKTVEGPGKQYIDRANSTVLGGFDVEKKNGLALEIVSSAYGMVNPNGSIVNARILLDGRTEFDVVLTTGEVERKWKQLSQEEIGEVRQLLRSQVVLNSKPDYSHGEPCVDSSFDKRIVLLTPVNELKVINIKECNSLVATKNELPPPQLIAWEERVQGLIHR